MTEDQEIKAEEEFIDFLDDRIAQNLTEALVFNLQIPEGIHLVSGIGNGGEKNNKEAVNTWVKNQKLNNNEIDALGTLALLEDRLANELHDLKTRFKMYQ